MKFPFLNFFKLASGVVTTARAVSVAAFSATTGAFTGAVSMLNSDVTVEAHGSVASGTETLARADGEVHTVTAGGDFTVAFSGWPASGKEGAVTLKLTNGGAHTITWPGAVDWPGGVAPSLTAAGRDTLIFASGDGGTTIDGYLAGVDLS